MQDSVIKPQWEEENSQDFIDYGKYFVPDREIQINCICEVIPRPSKPAYILDLCCGAGLLTRALLDKFPECHVYGLDGSPTMIAHAEDVDVFWMKAGYTPSSVVASRIQKQSERFLTLNRNQ